MKKVRVVLSEEAEEVYSYLIRESNSSKTERSILNSLKKKVDLIKSNPHHGDPISKKKIPKEYVDKYGISNLFRIELSNRWRMLYTLTNDESEVEIISFILDIMDHKRYDKKLGYR
ncbi:MAG: type II toxin-antitoxin system RelE/ParE family toxin [Nanobdellota archaeon]